jgi:regulatory protein
MAKSPEYQTAKAKLESFCAYQERCTHEVKEKIRVFDLSDVEEVELIDFLRTNKYLDEERFARSYASGKFVIKGWGRIKIRSHLKAKFVSNDLIQLGLSEIDEDTYIERMKHLAQRKWSELSTEKNPWIKKQKLFRFLAGKGYEPYLFENLDF